MKSSIDKILDCSGLICPEPVMMLHKAVREVSAGQTIELIATDPSTVRDVAKFCSFLGHELKTQHQDEDKYFFYITKGGI